MEVWKIICLSKWVICRFHVNLPGCSMLLSHPLEESAFLRHKERDLHPWKPTTRPRKSMPAKEAATSPCTSIKSNIHGERERERVFFRFCLVTMDLLFLPQSWFSEKMGPSNRIVSDIPSFLTTMGESVVTNKR